MMSQPRLVESLLILIKIEINIRVIFLTFTSKSRSINYFFEIFFPYIGIRKNDTNVEDVIGLIAFRCFVSVVFLWTCATV